MWVSRRIPMTGKYAPTAVPPMQTRHRRTDFPAEEAANHGNARVMIGNMIVHACGHGASAHKKGHESVQRTPPWRTDHENACSYKGRYAMPAP
ncbi:hypothetical protein CFR80_08700 [Komagataeibacter oboediens]|uniref:Uncharacterized protein n=1 Tax=Komagataeibacter oboediens TaxID=65958 RepID=A0A318QXI6_9PROT|nr:hypothetical protein CFR80_08700 [Komagataeibacter oboediens]